MGRVFRARREPDGETVALKVIKQAMSADPGFRRRFLREARAAARGRAPEPRRRLRLRRGGRQALPDDALHRGRVAGGPDRPRGAAAGRGDGGGGRPDRRRPRRPARGRAGPPRRQAREHHARPGRATPSSPTSAWPGGKDYSAITRPGRVLGTRRLPGARADPWRRGAAAERRLRTRLRRLPLPRRRAALLGRQRLRARHGGARRAAARSLRRAPRARRRRLQVVRDALDKKPGRRPASAGELSRQLALAADSAGR